MYNMMKKRRENLEKDKANPASIAILLGAPGGEGRGGSAQKESFPGKSPVPKGKYEAGGGEEYDGTGEGPGAKPSMEDEKGKPAEKLKPLNAAHHKFLAKYHSAMAKHHTEQAGMLESTPKADLEEEAESPEEEAEEEGEPEPETEGHAAGGR